MVNLLPASAADGVQRAVKEWFEDEVPDITFEQLEPNDSGIKVSLPFFTVILFDVEENWP